MQPTEQMDRAETRNAGNAQSRVPFTHASVLNAEVVAEVNDAFEYHPWDQEQIAQGAAVRAALVTATLAIIENVPPGPDRSAAIRKIREARMDANSAITHGGKY